MNIIQMNDDVRLMATPSLSFTVISTLILHISFSSSLSFCVHLCLYVSS